MILIVANLRSTLAKTLFLLLCESQPTTVPLPGREKSTGGGVINTLDFRWRNGDKEKKVITRVVTLSALFRMNYARFASELCIRTSCILCFDRNLISMKQEIFGNGYKAWFNFLCLTICFLSSLTQRRYKERAFQQSSAVPRNDDNSKTSFY